MNEVYPNLWLGSLSAVRVIATGDDKCSIPDVHWTVITVLNSSKLISLTKALLNERIVQGTCHHMVWELADKPGAEFLSSQLKDVLDLIDWVVQSPPIHYSASNDPLHDNERPGVETTTTRSACLIHCARGVSRSVSVVAAWYISRKQTSLQKALELIRIVRPEAMPNIGFIASLRALEQCRGDVDLAIKRITRICT